MKKPTYSELLKDPRWQRKRLEVLERDTFTCQHCFDSESTLHVHHTIYRKGTAPWEYSGRELVTLCESCHSNVKELADDISRLMEDPVSMDAFYTLSELVKLGWGMESGQKLRDFLNSIKP